ncbi:MAG TPA: FtsX-like permease family protein [Anaerolineaceae bacterium]|nr:FtsX-like permease family protein [Anaerolineaceae bacterium]
MNSRVPMFPPGLWNVGWRFVLHRRWQSVLMVLGIALGVAVMVAIDLANASANRAFELSTETITGKATHQITGGPDRLDERIYTDLRLSGRVDLAAPVVAEYFSSPQLGDRPMQLLGIDPFSDAPFRAYLGDQSAVQVDPLVAFLTQPGGVLISRSLAERYGLSTGAQLTLEIGGRERSAFVAGLLDPQDSLSRRAMEGILLADIATAQELTDRVGRLDWIDLILPAGDASAVAALQAALPEGVRVETVAARTGSVEQMTRAFRLNLSALSMLALVVGLFLIYNTMTFSVVQRRPLFGTLRCLGVTRREIFALVASEALIVGVLGALAGIALGVLMGQGTVRAVTQTINDLYFTTTVRAEGVPLVSLIKGGVLGLLATVATAVPPAWEAASVPPRAALSRSGLEIKVRRAVLWTAAGGLGMIAAGLVLFVLPTAGLFAGFGGTFAVTVGFAMLAAITMAILMTLAVPVMGRLFGFLGRMAPRNLVNALSRTSVAVAALMVAVAVTIGVSLMIDSFRHTVTLWMEQTLQGDVYISVPSINQTTSVVPVDPQVVEQTRDWPGVVRADLLRSITVDSPHGPLRLSASNNPDIANERLFVSDAGTSDQIWANLQKGGILVTEPLANRLGLRVGSPLTLYTPDGARDFPVAGIYYDYSSSEGLLMMAMDVYRSIWKDEQVTAIGLRLEDGADPDAVTADLQDRLSTDQRLNIRPNKALRADILVVFDRTFAITSALRILATTVAFIGVLSALLLLQLEKQREIGILRALGLTGRQLWRLVMLETGLMGLVAGVLAMPTGYALALILIYVINKRSFGWTLQLDVNPAAFLQALAIALIAALLAGIYPAYKLGRMAAAEAIREE